MRGDITRHRRGGTGVDEIGRRLGLEEIHLAVEDGTPGEFPRRPWSRPRRDQRRDRGRRYDQSAMGRDLDEIIARVGVRRGKVSDDHLVDRVNTIAAGGSSCIARGPHGSEGRMTRAQVGVMHD